LQIFAEGRCIEGEQLAIRAKQEGHQRIDERHAEKSHYTTSANDTKF
jgi:hypothetical protein